MTIDWDRHYDAPEEDYAPEWFYELEKMLRDRNEGRCSDFLHGFGGRDADLDPEGCTGIVKIEPYGIQPINEDSITVTVSGHKTFCDPSYETEEELSDMVRNDIGEVAHSIVSDAAGYGMWTGDDWYFSFTKTVKVDLVLDDEDEPDIEATYFAVIKASDDAIQPYAESWSQVDSDLDTLYYDIPNYVSALTDQE